MFSRIRNFLSRHKKKLIVGSVAIGGVILMTRYVQRRIREWQDKETREFLERTRQQHHFESTERTCNLTVFSFAPKIKDAVLKALDSESLTLQLRNKPPNKVELWEELKILAFTRAAVVVYSYTMLVVMLRIQLNLIGGYMYWDSVTKLGGNVEPTESPPKVTSNLQQRYLTLCNYFLEEGVFRLCALLEAKVKTVVKHIHLKRKLTLQDVEQIFWALQTSVGRDDPIKNLSTYLIAPERNFSSESGDVDAELLNRMITETMDLLESEEVMALASSCVSQGFGHIVDRIAEYFVPVEEESEVSSNQTCEDDSEGSTSETAAKEDSLVVVSASGVDSIGHSWVNTVKKENAEHCVRNGSSLSTSNGVDVFVHPNKWSMPMAKLIPIVNGLIHQAKSDAPDPWIQQLILMDRLKVLGANVYEAFSQRK